MKRAVLLILATASYVCGCATEPAVEASDKAYLEADIASLQAEMDRGTLTALDLVNYYLQRIEVLDRNGPALRSILEVNPDARGIAEALDIERRERGARGPLHGIPVVLKANIDTGDEMATSAGSLALAEHHAPDDAHIVRQLRDAGAIILAKANLSEWANFRSTRSSSGWSSIGGQTRNPYDTTRNPCGSSSGSGASVAANLTVLSVGTETDGSVVCPAGINGIVGIKPTIGLVSRDGIIPIAHSQDTAGPMARSVRDAALMLNAMSAADSGDAAHSDRPTRIPDYAANLDPDGLRGRRIGVIRSYGGAGENPYVEAQFEASITAMRDRGAIIVDPIDLDTEGMGDAEYEVLLYEFKADLNAYLAESRAPLKNMREVMAFNTANASTVMPFFGQEHMELAVEKGPLTESAYLEALDTSKRVARAAIDGALKDHNLDALIAPTNAPAWKTDHVNSDHFSVGSSSLAAISGYASITVPAGYLFDLPVGISFVGGAFSEAELIRLAYAFEQATKARRAPPLP